MFAVVVLTSTHRYNLVRDHRTVFKIHFTDAPSILDTPSLPGVSGIFRTPNTESIRLEYWRPKYREYWRYERYICSSASSTRSTKN